MTRKTNQKKLVSAFFKGISGAGIILGALLSESVIVIPKVSAIEMLPSSFNNQTTELKKTNFSPDQNILIAQNSSRAEADRLYQEGEQLFKLHYEGDQVFKPGTVESLKTALEKTESARQLYRAVGDKGKEASALIQMGKINLHLEEDEKTLAYYHQAVLLYRAVGDRKGEATAFFLIAIMYDARRETQPAIDYYNKALPLARAVGDRQREAFILSSIGCMYSIQGEMQKALDYRNQALSLYRAMGDRQSEAST